MSIDQNTKTMNVEARDWLEAGTIVEVRGYLLPVDTAEPLESSTQFSATSYEIPIHRSADFWPEGENVQDFITAATEGRYEEEDESDS